MATVQDIYQQILNRKADPEGLLYWQNQFGNEVDANELAQFTRAAAPEIAQRDAASYAARTPAADIQALYQQNLGRAADPAGLLYWQNKFGPTVDATEVAEFRAAAAPEISRRNVQTTNTTGFDPEQIRLARLLDEAANAAAANTATTNTVTANTANTANAATANTAIQDLYQTVLNRTADPAGLLYWQNRFGTEVDANELAQFRAAAAGELASRANTAATNTAATNTAATNTAATNTAATNTAATNTAATNTAATTRTRTAVEDLYQTVLKREGDPTGLAYWQNRFGNEVDANELAIFKAAAANELAAQTVAAGGRTAVQDLYRTELNREGDPAGLAYWQNRFGNEVDANELAIFRAAAAGERTTRGILPGGGAATVTPTALTGQNQVVAQTNPFANALQGLPSNFQAYQSIPLGGQYNYGRATPNTGGIVGTASGIGVPALYGQILGRPGETEGVNYWTNKFGPTIDANEITEFQTAAAAELARQTPASPYQNIMGQSARGFTNPYANYVGGQALGGYDPGLYGRIQTADNAATAAADAAAAAEAARLAAIGSGDDGGAAAAAAAAASAADSAAAAAASASGTAPGGTGAPGSGAAKGGYVHGGLMFGENPPGPDDGAVNLDLGEYVIKKSSVKKYGRGLLDMINEGKVPAKKMKSLLG